MSDAVAQTKPKNGLFVDYCAKDFLDGTQMLDPWEELAYRRIVDLIYASNDQLADNDKKLAWSTKVGNRWKTIKQTLIDAGKIYVQDGRITNKKCQETLQKSAKRIAQKSAAGKASAEAAKSLSDNGIDPTAVVADVDATVITGVSTNQEPKNPRLEEPAAIAADGDAVVRHVDDEFHSDDMKETIFGSALDWIAKKSGKPKDRLRSAAGKWCKDHGDDLTLKAMRECAKAGAVDPVPWITAWLKEHGQNGKSIEAPIGRGESVLARAMRRRGIEAGSTVGHGPGGDADALLPAIPG